MTDAATEPTRSGPSRAWYAAALLPFLLSLIPAYALGQAAAGEVEVQLSVVSDGTVELDGDELAVYATAGEVSERVRCRLRSATGDVVLLDRSRTHPSTEQDGTTWFRVGTVPSDVDDGTYALRCRAGGKTVDASAFAVSDPTRWARFALLLIAAFGVPVAAAVLGTLIFVAVMAMRRRAQRPEERTSTFPIQLDE